MSKPFRKLQQSSPEKHCEHQVNKHAIHTHIDSKFGARHTTYMDRKKRITIMNVQQQQQQIEQQRQYQYDERDIKKRSKQVTKWN